VHILICTPGRLVEHINLTPGFTLDYVRWLVVDEADKLLAQSFQQWIDVVMERLDVDKPGARDFPASNKSRIRKVILSATMTRDLSLLSRLKLHRPRLIVLEGARLDTQESTGTTGEHVLPQLLRESAIKVRDPNLKPLYLVDLLSSNQITSLNHGATHSPEDQNPAQADAKEYPETSPSPSYSHSDPDSLSNSQDEATSCLSHETSPALGTTVLIFTKSNETAMRLSRLLSILSPHLAPLIGTLTSGGRTSQRRKTLRAFAAHKLRILVASDLVARGIDLPDLDHVINYDMPTSVASYVHRVGRTARAGRAGHAWTLVTYAEAAWFWRQVAGEGKGACCSVERSAKVERMRVGETEEGDGKFSESRVRQYENSLEQLGKEAGELRRRMTGMTGRDELRD
jgi:ATP-dependent RNA helicase DDX51/DBP6